MRHARSTARHAFSLLEMVLALALGMVLLLALYLFLSTNVFYAQAGRDVLAEGTIVRNIMAKMNADISGQVGPIDPRLADYGGGAAPGAMTPATTMVTYNTGVYGQPSFVILSNFRVQKPKANMPTNVPELEGTSDLRRTMYWLVSSGADAAGLARAEIRQATSPDVDSIDPTTLPEQNKYVFAPEVKNIVFEYYDGTVWQPTWDGTTVVDGSPPNGSPRAIRITLTLKNTLSQAVSASTPSADGPTYQQIVAIQTTNSFTPKLANP